MYVPILQPPSSRGSSQDNVTDLPNVIVTVAFPGAAGRSKNYKTEENIFFISNNTARKFLRK